MRFGFILAGLLAMSMPAAAQNVGLMIGNEDYVAMRDVKRADRVVNAADVFRSNNFEVIARRDANLADMTWALSEFGQRVSEAETLIVVLAGRFVNTSTETYFLPVDAQPGPLATLAQRSLPLSTVFAWLAAHPGDALLLLSTDGASAPYSDLLNDGFGELDIPEGVSVLAGGPRGSFRFLSRSLHRPDRPYIGAARQAGLTALGDMPDTHILIETETRRGPVTAAERRADILNWRNASQVNTAEAYEGYINAHPEGEFVRMAENRIRALNDTPEARAERGEQALDLSRDARRAIQRDLSLLGFNTRGIDGIFGRGTRGAISAWQQVQGVAPTGFLSREEIDALNEQAERRAAELEADAERLRQEQMAADINYWDQTGASGDEEGLRTYLARYPDGEFAEVALTRLDNIEREKRGRASAADRRLWDQVRQYDSIPAYDEYLRRAPNGAFRDEALTRLEELENERDNSAGLRAAQAGEQALNLSPRTRKVVEARLKGLDLKPGPVDGVFDDDTRRAIRRYQAARRMEETGYLSEAVVVQLLADTVRQIFR